MPIKLSNLGKGLFTSRRGRKLVHVQESDAANLEDSLQECPFCLEFNLVIRRKTTEETVGYQTKCKDCGALGPIGNSRESATRLWNTRGQETEKRAQG